jgi:hypothetical protein
LQPCQHIGVLGASSRHLPVNGKGVMEA